MPHYDKCSIAGGLGNDVQQHFPNVPAKVLQGLYLSANAGLFNGVKSVYLLTGIKYQGDLPQAKAIADDVGEKVAVAVKQRFP